MLQNDLILDFNLYLCEKFGYRNSCSVMQNANGFCVDIRERDLDCYIRFWEYSNGRGNFPDWSIIICAATSKRTKPKAWRTWLVSSKRTCHATVTNISVPKVMTTSITRHLGWSSSIKTYSGKRTMDWQWMIWMSDTWVKVKEGIFPLLCLLIYR